MNNNTAPTGRYSIIQKGNGALHIDGLDIRSTGRGRDMGDHVSYYAQSACAAITRIGPFRYTWYSFDDLAETVAKVEVLGYREKVCSKCMAHAREVLAAGA